MKKTIVKITKMKYFAKVKKNVNGLLVRRDLFVEVM